MTKNRFSLVALLVALLLTLTACGARLSTQVALEENGAGTRTISFTMANDADTQDRITGGYEAVEAAIKKHLPEGLQFSGLTVSEQEVTGNFTLSFTDLDDYKAKVAAIVKASGGDLEPEVTMFAADNALKKGFEFTENFSSMHLLSWVSDALVAEGVIAQDDAANVIEGEDGATVTYGGQTYTNEWGGQIAINETESHGFDGVTVDVTDGGDESYGVVVRMSRMSTPSGDVKALDDKFLGVLKDVKVDADVDPAADHYQRTASFQAASADEVATKLEAVFGKGAASFQVSTEEAKGEPKVKRTYRGSVDSTQICADYCSTAVQIYAPSGFTTESGENVAYSSGGNFNLSFERGIVFDSLDFTADISMSRSWTLDMDLVIDTNDYADFLDDIEKSLTPSTGTMTTSDADGKRTYSFTFTSDDDADGVAAALGGYFTVGDLAEGEMDYVDADYAVGLGLDPHQFAAGSEVSQVTGKIKLGTMNDWVEDPMSTWSRDGSQVSYEASDSNYIMFTGYASGPTMGQLIGWIVAGVVVLLLIVLAIVFRKRLAKVFSGLGKSASAATAGVAEAARDAGAAYRAAAADAEAYAGQPGAGQPGVGGPGAFAAGAGQPGAGGPGAAAAPGAPVGSESGPREFTEHDLR
ncbi:hypothetical protein [Trueperella sp.]|uniref:hypothetical protein n=1 Tax=Trueperella sp. TaxID=2699835 RepID=UPI0026267A46|nr:hypothetical protein [Trueperella sp.]